MDASQFNTPPAQGPNPASETEKKTTALQPSGNVYKTGFGDKSVGGDDFDRYKGRKGHTDRIAILNPGDVTVAHIHYQEGIGFVICNSEYQKGAASTTLLKPASCCELLPEATVRIATLILQYHTDSNGQLVQPFGFSRKIWYLSENKFAALGRLNNEFPLDKHDLYITCEDDQWQKLQFQPTRESIYASEPFAKAGHRKSVEEWAAAMGPRIPKSLGRRLTAQELHERVGKAKPAAGPSTVDVPVASLDALLNS